MLKKVKALPERWRGEPGPRGFSDLFSCSDLRPHFPSRRTIKKRWASTRQRADLAGNAMSLKRGDGILPICSK